LPRIINKRTSHQLVIQTADDKAQLDKRKFVTTLKWIAGLKEKSTKKKCPNCLGKMVEQQYYTTVPKLIVFEYPDMDIKTSHCIKFKDKTVLNLTGIVYHGDNHFTCRIISPDGHIWFHDGISTGNAMDIYRLYLTKS
jgi:hypothetical protein